MLNKLTLLSLIAITANAHSNAPDCTTQLDCDGYKDACCGEARPTNGKGSPHKICWSKFSSKYLDEKGFYYEFNCLG